MIDGITVGEGVGVMVGLCGNTIGEDIIARVRWGETSLQSMSGSSSLISPLIASNTYALSSAATALESMYCCKL